MAHTDRVKQILSWYNSESPGVLTNLARLLNTGTLAGTTNSLIAEDIRPAAANLNKAVASAQASMDNLNAAIGDARPGLQAFSKQTVPEVGQLVRDLRVMSSAQTSVAEKIDQGGASTLIGSPKLPDYKGNKK